MDMVTVFETTRKTDIITSPHPRLQDHHQHPPPFIIIIIITTTTTEELLPTIVVTITIVATILTNESSRMEGGTTMEEEVGNIGTEEVESIETVTEERSRPYLHSHYYYYC